MHIENVRKKTCRGDTQMRGTEGALMRYKDETQTVDAHIAQGRSGEEQRGNVSWKWCYVSYNAHQRRGDAQRKWYDKYDAHQRKGDVLTRCYAPHNAHQHRLDAKSRSYAPCNVHHMTCTNAEETHEGSVMFHIRLHQRQEIVWMKLKNQVKKQIVVRVRVRVNAGLTRELSIRNSISDGISNRIKKSITSE